MRRSSLDVVHQRRRRFFPLTAYVGLTVGAAGRTPLRADTWYATKSDRSNFRPPGGAGPDPVNDRPHGTAPGLADEPLTYTAAADRLATLTDAAAYQLVALGTEAG